MCVCSCQEVKRLQGKSKQLGVSRYRRNLALEGASLHTRVLRDFFVGTRQPDDICAREFLATLPRWERPTVRSTSIRLRLEKVGVPELLATSLRKELARFHTPGEDRSGLDPLS